jgi:hypothetical protein
MKNRWLAIINVVFFVIVAIVLVFFIWNYSFDDSSIYEEECVEVNKATNFVYDACYDAYMKKIFLKVKRGHDSFDLRSMTFEFFDFDDKSYEVSEVPAVLGEMPYVFSSTKNPQNMNIFLNVRGIVGEICEGPKVIFVKYCEEREDPDSISVDVSPLDGGDVDEYFEVGEFSTSDSDFFSYNLVDKQRIWEEFCKSTWKCGDWSDCDGEGLRYRNCEDISECFVSTDPPITVQYCGAICKEDWECEWSDCKSGFSIPSCDDLNSCGTTFDLPKRIDCSAVTDCIPDVVCGEWSSCEIDYDFMDLINSSATDLTGIRSRLCADSNSCVNPVYESSRCSIGADIHTDRFEKCGKDFIGIYNSLSGELVARVDEGTPDNPRLNIYFENGEERLYCDYCFDGVLNGDEEGVDCGGSCEACETRYY